jgi:hypothetical protein
MKIGARGKGGGFWASVSSIDRLGPAHDECAVERGKHSMLCVQDRDTRVTQEMGIGRGAGSERASGRAKLEATNHERKYP